MASDTENDLTLAEIAFRLWAGKLLILGGIVLGLLAGTFYLSRSTFLYSATMKVTAAPSSQGAGGRASALSGLASLAGVSLGNSSAGASPFEIYLETLTSENVARRLAANSAIMQTIFKSHWDPQRGVWREPRLGTSARLIRSIKRALGVPVKVWRAPDEKELARYLNSQLDVQRDTKSPVVNLVLYDENPQFAATLLTDLNAEADRLIRATSLARARSYADYLQRKVPAVTIAEQRESLVQALSEQEKAIMMASSSVSYAATVISGPTVSPLPVKPKATVVLVVFVAAGLMLGALASLVSWRKLVDAIRRQGATN